MENYGCQYSQPWKVAVAEYYGRLQPSGMPYDPAQRRRALARFLKDNGVTLHNLTVSAGLAEGTTRGFMKNGAKGTRSLRDETYEQLADAATVLLDRPVTAAELRGETLPMVIKVESFVGIGAEVRLINGALADVWAEAPPSKVPMAAAIVKGESGFPTFEEDDVLFYPEPTRAIGHFAGEIVIAYLKDGRCMLRRVQGGQGPNTWRLLSVNPTEPKIENAALKGIAPIIWVKRHPRMVSRRIVHNP